MAICKICKKYTSKGNVHSTCKSRKWRKDNPIRAAYLNLKNNAKRRGKIFNISFEYFRKFAIRTDYCKKSGIQRESYHLDRIDENKGYVEGNLQLLQNHENIRKYHRRFNYEWDPIKRAMVYNTQTVKLNDQEDHSVPF